MRRTLTPMLLPAIAGLALAGCDVSEDARANAAVDTPSDRYLATAVGRVDAFGEARNLVASVDGVITRVHVRRGEAVRAGQRLVSIDCGARNAAELASAARARQASAEAETITLGSRREDVSAAQEQVRIARAARDDAADRLAQAEALAARGFVSQRELTARRHAIEAAEAGLSAAGFTADRLQAGPLLSEGEAARAAAAAASADVGAARALARQCAVISPTDGEVLQILRREGEFSGASRGDVIVMVGDRSRPIVRAEISDRDAALVHPGQEVDVWIEGRSTRWRGVVSELSGIMGRRSARSLDPTDRYDRDVREALLTFAGEAPPAIVGLRVMVGIRR